MTAGKQVPSARFRVRALLPALAQRGVAVTEFVPPLSSYPPARRWLRPFWLGAAVTARLPAVRASRRYDITLLQRELISTLRTLEGFTGSPRVLDVDDAIFLHRGGRGAAKIARQTDLIVAGNAFLADWFSQHQSEVIVIPTGIDTARFKPVHEPRPAPQEARVVIGWTGSAGNLRYLYAIEEALNRVLRSRPQAMLAIMSDRRPTFRTLPKDQWRFEPWNEQTEVAAVQGYDIGIMPLADGPWERGKCAFKLLQYLACARPVVASPVGVNADLLQGAAIGHAAGSPEDWTNALIDLIDAPERRSAFGLAGRVLVQAHYDTEVVAGRLATALRGLKSGHTG